MKELFLFPYIHVHVLLNILTAHSLFMSYSSKIYLSAIMHHYPVCSMHYSKLPLNGSKRGKKRIIKVISASLRCGPWARHIYPSLVLVQPRKTVPHNWKIVEWTLRIKTNKQKIKVIWSILEFYSHIVTIYWLLQCFAIFYVNFFWKVLHTVRS